jgi:hypothetical protein
MAAEGKGFTFDLDQAARSLGQAIAGERAHVHKTAAQIVIAQGVGDEDAVWALAMSLRVEADGAWQEEYGHVWSKLAAEEDAKGGEGE